MLKVLRFLGQNLAKVDTLHGKITAAYNVWVMVYEAIKPLLPAQAPAAPVVLPAQAPAAPAAEAPAAAAASAEFDSEGTPVE